MAHNNNRNAAKPAAAAQHAPSIRQHHSSSSSSPGSHPHRQHAHHHYHQDLSQAIRLQAGDGQILTTTVGVARLSSLLRGMLLEDGSAAGMPRLNQNNSSSGSADGGGTVDMEAIPLISISSECLRQIIEFCTHHQNDALAYLSDVERDSAAYLHAPLAEWDQYYFECMEQASLFEVILGSSYLDIPLLTDYCCKYLASMIRGKTCAELRNLFNIKGDLTSDEEKQVLKDFGLAHSAAAQAENY